MGQEINLLEKYPYTKRELDKRAAEKTDEDVRVARLFDKEYFDGDRRYGYGGFSYNPRFWQPVVPSFKEYYNLTDKSRILDVGCAKGFMVFDFMQLIPNITVEGVDISQYAIAHAKKEVKKYVKVGDARELPYEDNSFDLVISITTLHNLDRDGCKQALSELERVSRKDKFITVDAYRTEDEQKRMSMWNLTALTYMSTEEWEKFLRDSGYSGDYYWFIP